LSPAPTAGALVPSSVITGIASRQQTAERLAHPAGSGRTPRVLDTEALESIAAGLARTTPKSDIDWTQGTRRRYTRILDTTLYDAWLIEWSPASSLELHDHGGSRGVVAVTAGTLVETYTDLARRHSLRTRLVKSGESFTIPVERVHELSNPGPADAVSVHLYSPPLTEMTFYDHRPASYLNPLYTSQGDLAALEEAAT
jgi:mannose-6-phosphate isomerase-like protein (cupin superfamily)